MAKSLSWFDNPEKIRNFRQEMFNDAEFIKKYGGTPRQIIEANRIRFLPGQVPESTATPTEQMLDKRPIPSVPFGSSSPATIPGAAPFGSPSPSRFTEMAKSLGMPTESLDAPSGIINRQPEGPVKPTEEQTQRMDYLDTYIPSSGVMKVTPEQYAATLKEYGDKPDIVKKLRVTTQPGMKYSDFIKSVNEATKTTGELNKELTGLKIKELERKQIEAETKKEEDETKKASKYNDQVKTAKIVSSAIDDALKKVSYKTTGFLGEKMSKFSGTEAANLNASFIKLQG